ncbi:glycosyltransferase family 4 protein [Vogesella sp. GCM10023246]|uniref:Glycosyltransferase family 4 protein n=1 Tax=Vogesella oryzagri TaxID=3160864 RepID=A0ABV1M0C2_9NEIS
MADKLLTILHTESSVGWGGQEHRTFKEMVGLKKLGHRILLLTRAGARLAARAREAGIETFEIPIYNAFDMRAMWRIYRLIKAQRVDVVNTHSGHDSILGGLAGRLAGIKVVRTRHLALPITSKLTYSVLPHHVVSVSNFVRSYLIDAGIPDERVSTVYTGVDPEQLKVDGEPSLRHELGLPDSAKLVLTVAIMRTEKGHRLTIQAAPRILAACPDTYFIFAGDGPLFDELKGQVAAAGLADRILFLGLRRDIANVLASCDLFLLPTEQEALGTAFIEAMAMGLPVIGTNVDGVPEVVHDNVNGLLIKPSDPQSLGDAVIRLLSDDALRQQMAANSRELVAAQFYVDVMSRNMQTLLHKVVAQGGEHGAR